MADGTCSADGCDRPILCRGWCNGHYVRWRRTGSLGTKPIEPRSPQNPGALCSVPGCLNPNASKGLCGTHRVRMRAYGDPLAHVPIQGPARGAKPCTVHGCLQPATARGLCGRHYVRLRTHGDTAVNNSRIAAPCSVPPCGRTARIRGLCEAHHARLHRTGDVQAGIPIVRGGWRPSRPPCGEPGCDGQARKRGRCKRHYERLRTREIRADPVRFAASREYHRKWHEAWRLRSPRHRELSRAWRAKNPAALRAMWARRRSRKLGATTVKFTPAQLADRMRYWGNRCWVCSGPFEAVDHVKPLAKGGWHCLSNLRPICHRDNSRKRDKWPFPVATRV